MAHFHRIVYGDLKFVVDFAAEQLDKQEGVDVSGGFVPRGLLWMLELTSWPGHNRRAATSRAELGGRQS